MEPHYRWNSDKSVSLMDADRALVWTARGTDSLDAPGIGILLRKVYEACAQHYSLGRGALMRLIQEAVPDAEAPEHIVSALESQDVILPSLPIEERAYELFALDKEIGGGTGLAVWAGVSESGGIPWLLGQEHNAEAWRNQNESLLRADRRWRAVITSAKGFYITPELGHSDGPCFHCVARRFQAVQGRPLVWEPGYVLQGSRVSTEHARAVLRCLSLLEPLDTMEWVAWSHLCFAPQRGRVLIDPYCEVCSNLRFTL